MDGAGERVLRVLGNLRVHPAGIFPAGAAAAQPFNGRLRRQGSANEQGQHEEEGVEHLRVREAGVDVPRQGAVVQPAGRRGRAQRVAGGQLQSGLPVTGPGLGGAGVSLHAGAAAAAAAGARAR